ncbi:MAG: hypothetical protein ABI876_14390, partial [Bacteroidota bacterium]
MKLRPLAMISVCCAILALVLQGWPGQSRPIDGGPAAVDAGTSAVETDRIPPQFCRLGVYTYLTIPEWYLVWSSDEYADFIAAHPPSRFPYLAHLGQFWSGYRTIYDSTKDRYPFDGGYHMMIVVIGVSTSIEYGMKAGYENIVGRLAESVTLHGPTAEDSLAAMTARRYVEFIRVEPWYRFDFLTPLKKLWTEAGAWGSDPLRKWERKYFLTSEYAVKAAYGWFLDQAAGVAYGEEKPVTVVLLDRVPEHPIDSIPELHLLSRGADGSAVCSIPRYQAFTCYARALATAGANFLNIAGNNGTILVSAIVPAGFDDFGLRLLMRQPITTRPGQQRIVMMVPVREL